MSKKDIPAGYQLHIHSWENDGDAPSTEILSGLSKADTKFYIDLCNALAKWGNEVGSGASAEDGLYGEIADAIIATVKAHPDISPDLKKQYDLSDIDREDEYALPDACQEIMFELLGAPTTFDDYVCRVFDGFEVYFFEKPV